MSDAVDIIINVAATIGGSSVLAAVIVVLLYAGFTKEMTLSAEN